MTNDSYILALESVIVEHAGPMGKFVVKKSLSDLGIDANSISGDTQKKLIDMVLERAIYDKSRWGTIRGEIAAACGNGDLNV